MCYENVLPSHFYVLLFITLWYINVLFDDHANYVNDKEYIEIFYFNMIYLQNVWKRLSVCLYIIGDALPL